MLTLMLVCAFSPRVHSIPRGPPFLKLTTKRHNVSAKINTLHNASVCKQPPNANLWLGSCPLERTRSQYRMDVNGRDVNGAARHRAVLRYIAKRHKVSAKINTLHNASVCKQPPNANIWLGSCPVSHKQKTHNRFGCAFFVGGR